MLAEGLPPPRAGQPGHAGQGGGCHLSSLSALQERGDHTNCLLVGCPACPDVRSEVGTGEGVEVLPCAPPVRTVSVPVGDWGAWYGGIWNSVLGGRA